jgi:NADP-dependent 3-hydroxy acid dehydrogenase YdfG
LSYGPKWHFVAGFGAGAARRFARRGFQMMAGERCGDHLVTTYLAKVNEMKQFLRLAVNNQNWAKVAFADKTAMFSR